MDIRPSRPRFDGSVRDLPARSGLVRVGLARGRPWSRSCRNEPLFASMDDRTGTIVPRSSGLGISAGSVQENADVLDVRTPCRKLDRIFLARRSDTGPGHPVPGRLVCLAVDPAGAECDQSVLAFFRLRIRCDAADKEYFLPAACACPAAQYQPSLTVR